MAGACCITGSIFSGTPTGADEVLNGVACYVARPVSGQATKAIVLAADVFGFTFTNVRLLADRYASTGLLAVVPDMQNGDSVSFSSVAFLLTPATGFLDRLGRFVTALYRVPQLLAWVARHNDAVTLPPLTAVLEHLRASGVSRVACLGYCFGGRYSVLVGGKTGQLVDVAMAAHPVGLKPGDFQALRVPTLILCAEKDHTFGPAAVKAAQAAAAKRGAEAPCLQFRTYMGTTHGFASRGNEVDAVERAAMEQAFGDSAAFLEKHL